MKVFKERISGIGRFCYVYCFSHFRRHVCVLDGAVLLLDMEGSTKLSLNVLLSLSLCDIVTIVKCSDISLRWVNNTGLLST